MAKDGKTKEEMQVYVVEKELALGEQGDVQDKVSSVLFCAPDT